MAKVKLGQKVKCRLSGFTGVVTGRIEYINGCVRYLVLAKSKKGAEPVEIWIDRTQLEVVEDDSAKKAKATGGPRAAPPGLSIPR